MTDRTPKTLREASMQLSRRDFTKAGRGGASLATLGSAALLAAADGLTKMAVPSFDAL